MESPPKILIVEDEKDVCDTLVLLLEDEGYDCICVTSGEEALFLLEEHYFDLALVDIRLPGIDGITFIKKAHGICPSLRFIIFSGSIDINFNHIKSLDFVCDKIIYKPIVDSKKIKHIIYDMLKKVK